MSVTIDIIESMTNPHLATGSIWRLHHNRQEIARLTVTVPNPLGLPEFRTYDNVVATCGGYDYYGGDGELAALDCLNVALDHWLASDGRLDLVDLLDEAFTAIQRPR